jgi:predicted nucleic acid-binding protein
LPDNEAVYLEWRRIVAKHSVSGVQVYDARLAAAMLVHGIGHVLTLNVADFSRYSGVVAIHPSSV